MMLLYFLAFIVLVNCSFYIFFSRFIFGKSDPVITTKAYPVSVLICAKNEEENLKKHIPLILQQDYPDFELILINDAPSDESLMIMESFAEKDSRIKIVDVQNNEAFWANKKYALTLGIKKAANKRLLFTDADCKPAGDRWITSMASHFSKDKQLILGYGAYDTDSGFFNRLIRYETFITAILYFSFAKAGRPYMGVGRNLGYTSTLFYDNKGFASHMHIASGDDDLFVTEAATGHNTALCYNPESFTYSKPKTTLKSWLVQKRRHISTASHYSLFHKSLLAGHYIFNLLFWLVLISTLFLCDWRLVLAFALIRVSTQLFILGKGSIKLREKGLIWLLPLLELFLIFMQMIIFITRGRAKQNRWK